jgi:hypothetical protein
LLARAYEDPLEAREDAQARGIALAPGYVAVAVEGEGLDEVVAMQKNAEIRRVCLDTLGTRTGEVVVVERGGGFFFLVPAPLEVDAANARTAATMIPRGMQRAGLDIITDGEMRRGGWAVTNEALHGFELRPGGPGLKWTDEEGGSGPGIYASNTYPTVVDRIRPRRDLGSDYAFLREHARAGEQIEQGRLASVGIADDGGDRPLMPLPALALHRAMFAHFIEVAFQPRNPFLDPPAIDFELRFARPPRPDAAGLAGEVCPHSR